MTAAERDQAGTISIGEVLNQLRADFPDVTISKIRFLETEGLVAPARTPSARWCADRPIGYARSLPAPASAGLWPDAESF